MRWRVAPWNDVISAVTREAGRRHNQGDITMADRGKCGLAAHLIALVTCLVLGAAGVAAQTTTGTIRGFVRTDAGEPAVGAEVVATQVGTNARRSTETQASGAYTLIGLQPGVYEVAVTSLAYHAQTQEIRVLIGQTLSLDFTMAPEAIALEEVVVRADRVETRTQEVATNVTPEQIEAVPMNDRNFLSLAALAPGVTFGCQGGNCPPGDGGGLSAGGSSADNANVFVDGMSLKNDILRGGVAGQDASKGNPFPQVAVQEFRVITQQYKAEFPKATGPVIVATTRSGTNQWEAGGFAFRQDNGLIEQDFFALERCRDRQAQNPPQLCDAQAKQDRWQVGANLSGPIIRDRFFFFGSYEGNHQDRAFTVTANEANLGQWPTDVQQDLISHEGTHPSEFRSHLFFGKLTYTPSERHRFELIGNVRDEFDVRNFGGTNSLENAEDFNNDVRSISARHQFNRGNLLNEAQISYQYYRWFPVQLNVDLIGRNYDGTLKLGGRCCPQDRSQKKLVLRNDLSYTLPGRLGDHVFKVGGIVDFSNYFLSNPLQINPQFTFLPATPYIPSRVDVGIGSTGIDVDNTQIGIYAQDDWSVTPRLTLNLGLRWDIETNGLNNSYVTPAEVVNELGERDDLLIFNPDDYFTDGDDRPAFKGAIQPRVGFSYDVTGNNRTVLFGGFGIYYDRNSFGIVASEQNSLIWRVYQIPFSEDGSMPGTIVWDDSYYERDALVDLITSGTTGKPEAFVLNNNTKPPRSNQFSLGVRQVWRDLLFSVNYTGVRSYNNFTWFHGARDPETGATFQTPSYRNVLVSTADGRAWYDGLVFKVEKPYTRLSRWGGGISYTLGWTDDEFTAGDAFAGLSFHTPDDFVRRRSVRDQRHSVVANAIVGLPFDIRLSGILNLGSGRPFRVFYGGDGCTTGNVDCLGNEYPTVSPEEAKRLADQGEAAFGGTNPYTGEAPTHSFLGIGGWTFRNVDLRLEKEFEYAGQRIALVAEGFNVFNYDNFVSYDGRIADLTAEGGVTNVNQDFGKPTGAITDTRLPGAPRRWQFGVRWGMMR